MMGLRAEGEVGVGWRVKMGLQGRGDERDIKPPSVANVGGETRCPCLTFAGLVGEKHGDRGWKRVEDVVKDLPQGSIERGVVGSCKGCVERGEAVTIKAQAELEMRVCEASDRVGLPGVQVGLEGSVEDGQGLGQGRERRGRFVGEGCVQPWLERRAITPKGGQEVGEVGVKGCGLAERNKGLELSKISHRQRLRLRGRVRDEKTTRRGRLGLGLSVRVHRDLTFVLSNLYKCSAMFRREVHPIWALRTPRIV